jgi:hypothetical protein
MTANGSGGSFVPRVPANESLGRGNGSGGSFAANRSLGRGNGSRGSVVPRNVSPGPGNGSGGSSVPRNMAPGPGNGSGGSSVPRNMAPGPSNGSGGSFVPRDVAPGPGGSQIRDAEESDRDAEESDRDANRGDNGGGAPTRAARNSKPRGDTKPSHLGFYSGPWVDVLVHARNNYRKTIHTSDPFPERSAETLKVAKDILLEAIGLYVEAGGCLDRGSCITSNSWIY